MKGSETETLHSCESQQLRLSLFASLSSLSTLGFPQFANTTGRLLMKCPTLLPSLFTGIFSEELLLLEAKSPKCQWRVLEWEKGTKTELETGGPFRWAREVRRAGLISPHPFSPSTSDAFSPPSPFLIFQNWTKATSGLSRPMRKLGVGGRLPLGSLWGWQWRANLGINRGKLRFPLRAPQHGIQQFSRMPWAMSFTGEIIWQSSYSTDKEPSFTKYPLKSNWLAPIVTFHCEHLLRASITNMPSFV